MRILRYEQIKRDHMSHAAFSWALMRAIDPRILTHKPRDPEKTLMMKELGMDVSIPESDGTKKK